MATEAKRGSQSESLKGSSKSGDEDAEDEIEDGEAGDEGDRNGEAGAELFGRSRGRERSPSGALPPLPPFLLLLLVSTSCCIVRSMLAVDVSNRTRF